MSELSNGRPMEPEPFDRGNPARRCTAHRKNGERCRKWAIQGGTVCTHHGGKAVHVKRKAQRRLAEAADRMARALLNMATDTNVSDSVKLAAIRDALDRAGLSPKTAVEPDVGLKPYERILESLPRLETTSRAEWRRSQGITDDSDQQPPALAAPVDDAPLDAEIVDDELADPPEDQQHYAHPMTPDGGDWQPDERTVAGIEYIDEPDNPFGAADPPPDGLMPFDEAVIRAAAFNRRVAARASARGHASVRKAQRALPPGRSAR